MTQATSPDSQRLPFPGPFLEPDRLARRDPLPGIRMELGWGEKLMLSRVSIAPGASIPEHAHPHEQAGICLEGAFELQIGGVRRVVRRGEMYLIPSGVRHSARGLDEPAVTVDIFTPLREDYLPTRGEG